ncbi:MAG: hypothetical protein GXO11_06280 [Epsilonproteobacteria bacterium]|nr:hypothetical protein [Campylobacterota bacterium]
MKWISLLFVGGISIFIIYFLYVINSDELVDNAKPLTLETNRKDPKIDTLWLKRLAKENTQRYYFPVEEIYIKTDMVEEKKEIKPYQLVVNDLDPYQIFCLQQELKRYKLKFFFKKEKSTTNLLVFSQSITKLRSLVNVLKKYQINAKILKR